MEVSFSMPLDTDTTTVPGSSSPFRLRAVVRTAKEGVASTTMGQPFTQERSLVRPRASGRGTPLSMGFSCCSWRTLDSSSK